MTLKEKYNETVEAYRKTVEIWNECVELNAQLSDHTWDKLLANMYDAKAACDKAWKEYLAEILQ